MKRADGIGCLALWVALWWGFIFGLHWGRSHPRAGTVVAASPPCARSPIAPTLHDWGSGEWLAMRYDADARSVSSVSGQVVVTKTNGDMEMLMLSEQNVLTCGVP